MKERRDDSTSYQFEWGTPTPFVETDRIQFDLNWLPKVIGDYCREISDSLHVSADMAGCCALGILSSACQHGKVIINESTGWEEPLNLYVAVVADPGERKSPVLNLLKRPIVQWQQSKNDSLQGDIARSRAELKLLRGRLAKAENEAAKNNDPTLDEVVFSLAEAIDRFTPIKAVQLLSDDITSEALAVKMKDNAEKLSIISSEGGILETICGRYSQGTVNADIYLKSFFGEAVQIDRINRESDTLRNPILSMLLCIQPIILQKLVCNSELRHNGLVDRFLFCVPTSSIGKATFHSTPISEKTMANYHNVVKRLLDERESTVYVRLSEEAKDIFAAFFDHLHAFRIVGDLADVQGWVSKHGGIVARIAAILQLATDGGHEVSAENMQHAIGISGYFCQQVKIALGSAMDTSIRKKAEYLLQRIKGKGKAELSIRELQQSCSKAQIRNRDDLAKPLQELIDRGYVAIQQDNSIDKVQKIYVNPELLGGEANA